MRSHYNKLSPIYRWFTSSNEKFQCSYQALDKNSKLEIVFMKHYAPNQYFVHHPFHQVIYLSSSFSWPNLRVLAVLNHKFHTVWRIGTKRHFLKMWNLRMVNFDIYGGLTSVLKFHIFLICNCEELVRIRAICEGLVRFLSDVKNWYSNFTKWKNRDQFFTPVCNLGPAHSWDIDFPLY